MSSNSCTLRPVNDLKSNGFLDNILDESKKKGQEIDEFQIIYLFILIMQEIYWLVNYLTSNGKLSKREKNIIIKYGKPGRQRSSSVKCNSYCRFINSFYDYQYSGRWRKNNSS